MAASEKLALDKHSQNENWTVVMPRRGKKRIQSRRHNTPEAEQQPWVPTELESDPEREAKVLGFELKMPMVIYGIGSIESYETPRFQLSLAILMKRKFDWIGDIEVFDPILSATESLGSGIPWLFCPVNWELELLNHIVLFGNSFEMYEFFSEIKNSIAVESSRHILAARKFADEYVIEAASDDYFAAFHDSSWHFFSPALDTELLLVKN
ncbi:hypothetical protein OIU84_003448 [Salix udensis]|uniref:SRR1-like domain-containing protein n=1 Tax=Salix udensis TaxID=889485 RepID=A0AAD6JZY7_9ROSI|nr:hypothetical protein OIU84_003448 [Salix udensis]